MVTPARRWPRKPRSGPLQRSSASPIAATAATAGSRAEPERPAGEREPEPPEVDRERPGGDDDVPELATAVEEAAEVAAGGAVAQAELLLGHREPRAGRVDRHPRLGAEARREREAGRARRGREGALAGERRAGAIAGAQPDQRPRGLARDPEPPALGDRERRDDEVGVALEQRPEVTAQVRVGEHDVPRRRRALRGRERLALAAARQPEDDGAGGLRLGGGAVPRPVVGHDHLGAGELLPQRPHGVADPALLVARRHEDGDGLTRRAGQ